MQEVFITEKALLLILLIIIALKKINK